MVESALDIHIHTLAVMTPASPEQFASRGVDLVRYLGYSHGGIIKGKQAARGMSVEAKACGGRVLSVQEGGICASLQSIGARGSFTPKARKNVCRELRKMGLLLNTEADHKTDDKPEVEIPYYFSSSSPNAATLQDDYQQGGYNYTMAEKMLNESILPFCKEHKTPCNLNAGSQFKVQEFVRLENVDVFEKHKLYEARVAKKMDHMATAAQAAHYNSMPQWLKKLTRKNGLLEAANTVYLLHGTRMSNVQNILEGGLKAKFALSSGAVYGKGLYFTDSSCKASQFATQGGCILVCRVVLGRMEVLQGTCPKRLFATNGYDSSMAKKSHTEAPSGLPQLHNEFIVYDDRACYPEFVIRFRRSSK